MMRSRHHQQQQSVSTSFSGDDEYFEAIEEYVDAKCPKGPELTLELHEPCLAATGAAGSFMSPAARGETPRTTSVNRTLLPLSRSPYSSPTGQQSTRETRNAWPASAPSSPTRSLRARRPASPASLTSYVRLQVPLPASRSPSRNLHLRPGGDSSASTAVVVRRRSITCPIPLTPAFRPVRRDAITPARGSRPDWDLKLAKSVDLDTLHKLEGGPARTPFLSQTQRSDMSLTSERRGSSEDIFYELGTDGMASEDEIEQFPRPESRLSLAAKHRSLPAQTASSPITRRPSSGGKANARPSSWLYDGNHAPADLHRSLNHHRRRASRASIQLDASAASAVASSAHPRRFDVLPDHSPVSPSRLRESLHSGERRDVRRQSLGASLQKRASIRPFEPRDGSPTGMIGPTQADSTSADSQTADTVWDELDELKSRIKKLEFVGKIPPTSSAAASGDSSDRPRTATTAPTTIDSSPKHDSKKETEHKTTLSAQAEGIDNGRSLAGIHPALHQALAKAKPLLNGALFHTLEASANDALYLAALASGSGSQSTNYSAASISNGVNVSERHVRRKADSMCRNLTELCLALCEGKHEAPSVFSSPMSNDTITTDSPSLRYSRSNVGLSRAVSAGRPASRLDERRSSILGVASEASFDSASRDSIADLSGSDQDSAPNQQQSVRLRRISRAPSSLLRGRQRYQEDQGGEDDPTIRPPSRAMTDINSLRAKARLQPPERSPGYHVTPSLRESLMNRRANENMYMMNREVPRVASLGGSDLRLRRLYEQSTPPVMEEENNTAGALPPSQLRYSVQSVGQPSGPRTTGELLSRTGSLNQRRRLVVE